MTTCSCSTRVTRSVSASSCSAVIPKSLSRAANASLVGANTSIGPGVERTSVRFMAWTAATRVERSGVVEASSAMSGRSGEQAFSALATAEIEGWLKA